MEFRGGCWYREYNLEDVEQAKFEDIISIARETLRRLWCYKYGYADTPIGEKYVEKLKLISKKIDQMEFSNTEDSNVIKWLTWVMQNKAAMNKILLSRFQFREVSTASGKRTIINE